MSELLKLADEIAETIPKQLFGGKVVTLSLSETRANMLVDTLRASAPCTREPVREVPHEDCLNCRCEPEDQCAGVRVVTPSAAMTDAPAPETLASVDLDLIERCKELIEWGQTGLLHGGEGGSLRKLAATWEAKVGEYQALSVAEKETHDQAMKALVSLAAAPQPTAMTAEPVACEKCNVLINEGDGVFTTKTGLVHFPHCPPSSGNADAVQEALQNMMGVFDTPVSRRRMPPDDFMKAAIESGRAALSRPAPDAAGSEWQDISTAPKDGRKVWIYGGHRNVPCETEADGEWWRRMAAEGNTAVPTHWMEHKIPAPPSKSAPVFKAAQNIAESDPVVTPGCAGADTVSRNDRGSEAR